MAKKKGGNDVLHFVAWFTGVIVSLAVGSGLIDKVLGLPSWLGGTNIVTVIVGWIVVITTLVGVVMALLRR